MSELQISPENLRSHAGHLGQICDAVDQAVDAAGQSSISDGSLGMMIGPLIIAPLLMAENLAGIAISSSGEAVSRLADQVREVAADFESSESGTKQDFQNTEIPTYGGGSYNAPAASQSTGGTGRGYSPSLAARMGG